MVTVAKPLEPAIEPALKAGEHAAAGLLHGFAVFIFREDLLLQQPDRHGWHQCAGQDERCDHREHDSHRQRFEEVAADPAERKQRQPDDADADGRYEGWNDDLIGRVDDRGFQFAAFVQVGGDVFDHHRRVVHEDADRQGKAAQCHHIDRLPQPRQGSNRGQDAQRDRDGDNHGRAPRPQKQQYQRTGQHGRGRHFAHDIGDRGAHEFGGVVQRSDFHPFRQGAFDLRKQFLDSIDHGECRGVAGFQDLHQHGLVAADQDHVALRRPAAVDIGDIAQIDDGVAHLSDRDVVERVDIDRGGVGCHQEVELADFLVARRQHQILGGERLCHVFRRHPVLQQRLLVQIDLDDQRGTAVRCGDGHARNRDQSRADEVRCKIIKFLHGLGAAGHLQVQNRDAGCIVHQDGGGRDARGHLFQDGLGTGRDLCLGGGYVGTGLKEDFDDTAPVKRLAFDMLDVADRGRHRPFEIIDDAAGHILGQKAVVCPDNGDNRNVDGRKYVCRGFENRLAAEDDDKNGQNDESEAPSKGDNNNRVH